MIIFYTLKAVLYCGNRISLHGTVATPVLVESSYYTFLGLAVHAMKLIY